jgi:FkbM family methyltransferase
MSLYHFHCNTGARKPAVVSGERDFLGDYVVDAGANVGNFSREVCTLWPHARVYEFEPHPRTFEAWRTRAERFGFRSVNAGCGDKHGALEIYDYASRDGSSHASLYRSVIEDIRGQPSVRYTVDVVTLDEFAATEGVERIDLLKIDTEGHEYHVLRGSG